MMTGQVNSKREAVISLTLCKSQTEERQIETVIDTGYSGYLALSAELIAEFSLISIGTQQVTLADGREVDSAIYPATIVWDGRRRAIEIDNLETVPLVGMALLEGHDLKIRIAIGGRVTIESFFPTQPPTE